MPENDQLIIAIALVLLVLVFFGVLFLIMLVYYNRRKMLMKQEKQSMQEEFERQLLQSTIEMQEQTFQTISGEIHDNIGQMLTLVKLQMNTMQQQQQPDLQRLGEMKEMVSTALAGLRDIARSLNADRIHQLTIEELIAAELKRVEKAAQAVTFLTIDGEPVTLGYKVKLILFRIVQESLQNILKHAGADEIKISIGFTRGSAQILIEDNGRGFDTAQLASRGAGIGLQNMRGRAVALNADFIVNSRPGAGCTIQITVPAMAPG